jgi:hypothetical protein
MTEESNQRGEGEDVSERRDLHLISQLQIRRDRSRGCDGVKEEKKEWAKKW